MAIAFTVIYSTHETYFWKKLPPAVLIGPRCIWLVSLKVLNWIIEKVVLITTEMFLLVLLFNAAVAYAWVYSFNIL